MLKRKQRCIRHGRGRKQQNQISAEVDPPDEADWVVVKKQRITILIPPLPNKVQSTMPDVGQGQLQEKPGNTNSQLPCQSGISVSKQSVPEIEKSKSLSAEHAIDPPTIVHPSEPNITFQKPSSLCHRIASDSSPHGNYGEGKHKGIATCSVSKCGKGLMIFGDSTAFLDQRMRALHLEKKLKKAGGLENWLVSLGLARFIKVFQRRSMNKFQLANLTMKKLKDMGADAVGPRRKLMHAIDCVCEPHCFQHV
ncbi:hypothetical protein CDL12_20625 [Handroanthus impetiginosus]|uniref:SAM domain-containing protein n=1 Tax=Handroanthus impetiginosus TaxID=429701 RepID=A0A2G9GND9_9LAMI|nr:hypothetical protein CDL12_20625 [Handroanthus impetiginosus]